MPCLHRPLARQPGLGSEALWRHKGFAWILQSGRGGRGPCGQPDAVCEMGWQLLVPPSWRWHVATTWLAHGPLGVPGGAVGSLLHWAGSSVLVPSWLGQELGSGEAPASRSSCRKLKDEPPPPTPWRHGSPQRWARRVQLDPTPAVEPLAGARLPREGSPAAPGSGSPEASGRGGVTQRGVMGPAE